MGMAETGDTDPTGKIQESPPVCCKKIGTFPTVKGQIRGAIRRQDSGNHVMLPKKSKERRQAPLFVPEKRGIISV
jgi:hypothetical protein